MMSSVKVLNDDGARHDAISRHDRSILVEAGAGSGKTAVMAGRIAVMLAQGVAPSSIAAVTLPPAPWPQTFFLVASKFYCFLFFSHN
mgnify:CR=1 FL=1